MKLKYIEVNQPIGTFYLTSIRAIDLLDIVRVDRRRDFKLGVQRIFHHQEFQKSQSTLVSQMRLFQRRS